MKYQSINKSTLDFLKKLAQHNQRDWFNEHKDLYLTAQENMIQFIDQLIDEMNKHDVLEDNSAKKSLFRIYNDVRFSKDKSPYNPRFAFSFSRATKLRRGGYYMNIKPGNCYLAAGFFAPNPKDTLLIRKDMEANFAQWTKLLNSKKIKDNFGELQGEALLTAPRGFDKDHPAIKLIRHKRFILRHDFTDEEVLSADFLKKANNLFMAVRPYFDRMSELLTLNSNGEIIV